MDSFLTEAQAEVNRTVGRQQQQQQIQLVNGSTPCPCSSPLKSISSACFALLAATCLRRGRRSAVGTRRAAPPSAPIGRPPQDPHLNTGDKMGSRFLVMFIISLTLLGGRSMALDNAVGEKTPDDITASLSTKENPQLCQLCEQFATEALFYLNENETQIEIIDTLHQTCSKFYSFKLEVLLFCLKCRKLVDYYAPLFFTKIASLSPDEFCAWVSLCEEVTFIRLPRHEDACILCHEVVDKVLSDLEDPDMELKIIGILLKGCNNAENFVQKCKRLIIQNAAVILEHIKKFLKRGDFCNSIHVCRGKTVHAGAEVLRALSTA